MNTTESVFKVRHARSMKGIRALVWKNKKLDFCLTRYCSNPKNSTQSATSSIFQDRQEGAPSESKVGSNPLSNLVGVFRELLTSPSAIFVYRGNIVLSQKSLRYEISNLAGHWGGGWGNFTMWGRGGRDMLKPMRRRNHRNYDFNHSSRFSGHPRDRHLVSVIARVHNRPQ